MALKHRPAVVDPYEVEFLAGGVREQILLRLTKLTLKRKDLASRLGVSEGRVSQILSGSEHMNLRTLVAIASALGTRCEVRLWPEEEFPRVSRLWEVEPIAPITREHVSLPGPDRIKAPAGAGRVRSH